MINYDGTYNQIIKKSSTKLGGALVVFEGHPQLLVGGFNFDLDDLPAPGIVLPCGTPVYCDEAARTITPVVTATVSAVDGTDATKVTLADVGFGTCAFNVGDTVAIVPASLNTVITSGNYATITAIDGLEITLSGEITSLTANKVIVQLDSSKKIKAVPNAILPYDVCRSADAISVDGDGMIGNDRPLLERRMPPYNDALKAAVQANGHKLTFSNRK